jgi:FlaA1/EpsC-like NDP-sugar epimerase
VGLALLIDPYSQFQHLLAQALVVSTISHPPILCGRVLYRFLEELVSWSRSKDELRADGRRVLLYGAGGRCWLFLSELGFNSTGGSDGRSIVGVIDDDHMLHFQWVYGYQVLGGRRDLSDLIARHKVTGIIVTALLTPESTRAVREFAARHELDLTEWHCEERQIERAFRAHREFPAASLAPAGGAAKY